MEFYLIQQDKRYSNTPIILDVFKKINVKDICKERSNNIQEVTSLYVKSNKLMEYIDVVDKPLFFISDKLKDLLIIYEPFLEFKTISLIDYDNSQNEIYWLPIFDEIDCLSEKSEFNLDKSVLKKIVLREEVIKDKSIFKLKGVSTPYIIIRLDLAESILRRDFKGIILTRIQTE